MVSFASVESNAVAAVELASLVIGSVDVVGIFDQKFNQLFQYARPLRATVKEVARSMEHPLENGQIITDYRILLPLEVSIPVIINRAHYVDTYQQIRAAFVNSTVMLVRTRIGIYADMILTEIPHEEDAEKYDAITMFLKFKQLQLVQSNSDFAPVDPTQSDTQQLGQQNGSLFTLTDSVQTQLDNAFAQGQKFIGGIF